MPDFYIYKESNGAIDETGTGNRERVNRVAENLPEGSLLVRRFANPETQRVDILDEARPLVPKTPHPATTTILTGPDPHTVTVSLGANPSTVRVYDRTVVAGTNQQDRTRAAFVLGVDFPAGGDQDFLFDFPGDYEIDVFDLRNTAGIFTRVLFVVDVDLWDNSTPPLPASVLVNPIFPVPISQAHAQWFAEETKIELEYLDTLSPGNPNQTAAMLEALVSVTNNLFTIVEFILQHPVDRGTTNPGPPPSLIQTMESMLLASRGMPNEAFLQARLDKLNEAIDRRRNLPGRGNA